MRMSTLEGERKAREKKMTTKDSFEQLILEKTRMGQIEKDEKTGLTQLDSGESKGREQKR